MSDRNKVSCVLARLKLCWILHGTDRAVLDDDRCGKDTPTRHSEE